MKSNVWIWVLLAASLALVAVILFFPPPIPENLEFSDDPETLARGEYLVTAGAASGHRGVRAKRRSVAAGLESDFRPLRRISRPMRNRHRRLERRGVCARHETWSKPAGRVLLPSFRTALYAG